MKMTESLFDEIINTAQDCVFWKDTERRFAGVNRAFLDFYGFDSDSILIGKTDEDMGWHNDPDPFKQDELRVLAGESTYKKPGKCMVGDEERDIIASKRPIYDNGKIVGLVGSFVDVTDVIKRRSTSKLAQILYTAEDLRRFPYFDRVLDETRLEDVLDPLTGVISRAYFLDFARSLIARGTPFSFIILDLDNFKFINDTHGHPAGDRVLMEVAKGIAAYTEGYGLAGRFGGDELLMIDLHHISYDDKKSFFEGLYTQDNILRRSIDVEGNSIFITGTSGCASFPSDADSYDRLFALIDKTLYRGKSKGRNCYTIYVREKHENLEIKSIARQGICTSMRTLTSILEPTSGFENKLQAVMPFLREELLISDLYYAGSDGVMRSVINPRMTEDISDIKNLPGDGYFSDSTIYALRETCPLLHKALSSIETDAILIVPIETDGKKYGHLICAQPHSQRIWQDYERGLVFYLAHLLAVGIRIEGDVPPDKVHMTLKI